MSTIKPSKPLYEVRLSVRALVAFSVFAPDIKPLSASLMEEGRQAHLGRQEKSGVSREQGLKYRGARRGVQFTVSGRMDLYDARQSPPLIEEIKLSGGEAPQTPRREHLYQALCYGYMLCLRDELEEVTIRVSYATVAGELVAAFDECYSFDALEAAFFYLLDRYAAWHIRIQKHKEKRDRSIAALPFPYPGYREGQKEMARQVYTAILRRRRLYAVMPTGTGKSAAVLYPALKALGLGLTGQVFCLTARTTARLAMENEFRRMQKQGLHIKALTLSAKEKLCPMEETRCEPGYCQRAKGHYERLEGGLTDALKSRRWDTQTVVRLADRHRLCPFEFSLSLSELADAVICDYNYAFDPRIRIQRIFDQPGDITLLVDEAHNLPDRLREMLSGTLSAALVQAFRRGAGLALSRRHPLYKSAGVLLKALREGEPGEALLTALSEGVSGLLQALREHPDAPADLALLRQLLSFQDALRRQAACPNDYQLLILQKGRQAAVQLLCLDFTPYITDITRKFCGFVCYSATLNPLDEMSRLLGAGEEDACLQLPSPFPPDNLLVLQLPVNTRYLKRQESIPRVCWAIQAMFEGRPGKYIAFFPSYQYMTMAAQGLAHLPLQVQEGGMDEAARERFIAGFTKDKRPLLALCVLGGIFAEGIDLPGEMLIGVCIVGVGFPQMGPERDAISRRADEEGKSGFNIAYRYPGMHKVLQAAGRLIRSGEDRGVLLLCDDRYAQAGYKRLLPEHYRIKTVRDHSSISLLLDKFWNAE